MNGQPSYLGFRKSTYDWKAGINYREQPDMYKVGKGEQGVLICEPYKSEIGVNWRFKNKRIAKASASKIYKQFLNYLKNGDFVGTDMARKYLQMGYIRARRYANYKGGKKYDAHNGYSPLKKGTGEPEKADAARIFFEYWKLAGSNEAYAAKKQAWKKLHG